LHTFHPCSKGGLVVNLSAKRGDKSIDLQVWIVFYLEDNRPAEIPARTFDTIKGFLLFCLLLLFFAPDVKQSTIYGDIEIIGFYLYFLDMISSEHNAPRDALVEYSFRRLLPIIAN
jgi:hypothetical protein